MESYVDTDQNINSDDLQSCRSYTVDVIIPVYHPDEKLHRLLIMLYNQTVQPSKVLLLHTVEKPEESLRLPEIPGSNIIVLPVAKENFDHGGTRKLGASNSDADILMFMTQDAVPVDEFLIEKLIIPYWDPLVAATYARQLPGKDSDVLERYTRYFNYPKKSRIKSSTDISELGIKTIFCSNVCATYRNETYRALGGFVERTIFNEDMIMAYGIINAGYKIVYMAEAKVLHSHRYSYLQQFTRNFDLGVSHKQYASLFGSVKSEAEGMKLVKETAKYLAKHRKYLQILDLAVISGFKYLGYRFGLIYDKLPKNFVVRCSMNKSYWK
jgi:rhamnosyltransferase